MTKKIRSNGTNPNLQVVDPLLGEGEKPEMPIIEIAERTPDVPPNLTQEQLQELAGLVTEVVFSDVEKQILSGAMAEAQQAINDHRQVQEMLQQKRDVMIGLQRAAEKVYKAVMILKKVNPDAYGMEWNPNTNEILLKKK